MAQAMQSASQNSATAGSKAAGGGQKAGGSGSKNNQKERSERRRRRQKGGRRQVQRLQHSRPQAKIKGIKQARTPPSTPATPEMQKAAQAMQQNDAQGLSEQLRQMANRTESGKMSPSEQQQAARDMQILANALKNTPMPETQQHSQAAADALKRGDKQTAASEMRKAADAAEREAQAGGRPGSHAGCPAVGGGRAKARWPARTARATFRTTPARAMVRARAKARESGQGQGEGDGEGEGDGQGLPNGQGKHGSGKGNGGSGGGGMAGGKPGDTGEGSSPLKHLGKMDPNSAKSARLYFGKPLNAGPSKTGPMRKVGSNPNAAAGQTTSSVPYYNYVAPAQKSAESTMDKEDIPPAYRSDVRKYFNSLNPPAPTGSGH